MLKEYYQNRVEDRDEDFKEVGNVLHSLQGEAVSLGVTFVFWCFL